MVEIIGVVVVGDMVSGVNFCGEVGDYIFDFILVIVFGKIQYGEIVVLVIDFVEMFFGYYVGFRQWQQ